MFVWSLQAWMTASSSTSRLLRGRKSGGTNCCVSPTRSWRIWGCPESATRSSYWRLWTYCVLWWVQASHAVFPLLCCHSKESQMKIFLAHVPSSKSSKSFKSQLNPTIPEVFGRYVVSQPAVMLFAHSLNKVINYGVFNRASHFRNGRIVLSKESLSY